MTGSPSLVDVGRGDLLVLVPGIQGRWEYMAATVEALARSFRVVTFSLAGERTSGVRLDPARGLGDDIALVGRAIERSGVSRAIVCGVSYGGVVALEFAARYPRATRALVLASTPGPGWHLRPRHELYARLPWLFGPLFLVETPFRLRHELRAAMPGPLRRRFAGRQLRTFLRGGVSPSRMAARARLAASADLGATCARVTAPTLVVTGERALDHVVPVDGTVEYARRIRDARAVVVPGTGHLGCMTRPGAFAAEIERFVEDVRDAAA